MTTSPTSWQVRGNRLMSLALAWVWLLLAGVGIERGPERDVAIYDWAFSLGYAHLVGAAWRGFLGWRALHGDWADRWIGAGIAGLVIVQSLLIYSSAIHANSGFALPLMLISTWHSIENDRRMPDLYARRSEGAVAGGISARDAGWLLAASAVFYRAGAAEALGWHAAWWPEPEVACLGLSALSAAAMARACRRGSVTPGEGASWLVAIVAGWLWGAHFRFAELFALVTLYHVNSWALYLAYRRFRDGGARAALASGFGYVFALAILWLLRSSSAFDGLRQLVLSPGLYLLFATLHVAHTSFARDRSLAISSDQPA